MDQATGHPISSYVIHRIPQGLPKTIDYILDRGMLDRRLAG
jgi:hypothetical protein